jgi:amino acid transporter
MAARRPPTLPPPPKRVPDIDPEERPNAPAGSQAEGTGRRRPQNGGRLRRIKRLVVGSPMRTESLAHERLGKPTALAVFASDNLSSSAYATEEILRVLVKVVGAAAFAFVVPITVGLLVVLGILLFSYRQTIKAYPQAGGAYLVTRDNFGVLPAQVAGVSLLTDYVLTVAVSVAAGTAALTSVFSGLFPFRVMIGVGFIALIALGNLRGVRESGRIFALPTFFFIAMMALLLGFCTFRLLTGQLHPAGQTFPIPPTRGIEALSLFLILHAFASGGAAVTGVEAISNGVPAFKPPEWRNAITTLMWMGFLLGAMFLGISIMAAHLRVVPDPEEKVTVLAQVARAAFGGGAGTVLFVMLQAATMLILVLAANTSFADFPRLASFHAGDHFLPRQLTRYGDRLVFSNGIIALSVLAALLVVVFKASVTKLIPLYAIGVFTSFTFSQSGMAVRHRRLKEPGWVRGMIINGTGAVVSGVMTVVIAGTKFGEGAWVVLVSTPLLLFCLLRVNRHYKEAEKSLKDPARKPTVDSPRQAVVVAMDVVDGNERDALAYAKRVFPTEVIAVRFVPAGPGSADLLGDPKVGESRQVCLSTGNLALDLKAYLRMLRHRVHSSQIVNVIIAETVTRFDWLYVLRQQKLQRLKSALLDEPNVVVTNLVRHKGFESLEPGAEAASYREDEAWRHVAVLLVGDVNNASLGALRYARSVGAQELHCLHVAVDEAEGKKVAEEWQSEVPRIPLEVLDSPYRQITGPVKEYVHNILESKTRTFVTIVLPEVLVQTWWQKSLHNKNALLLKGSFLFEPSVVVSAVPYRL